MPGHYRTPWRIRARPSQNRSGVAASITVGAFAPAQASGAPHALVVPHTAAPVADPPTFTVTLAWAYDGFDGHQGVAGDKKYFYVVDNGTAPTSHPANASSPPSTSTRPCGHTSRPLSKSPTLATRHAYTPATRGEFGDELIRRPG